jgi:hypothetical protein
MKGQVEAVAGMMEKKKKKGKVFETRKISPEEYRHEVEELAVLTGVPAVAGIVTGKPALTIAALGAAGYMDFLMGLDKPLTDKIVNKLKEVVGK